MGVSLVTYSSPSHREMCDRFVLSRAGLAGFGDDSVILFEDRQVCESATYNKKGFSDQTAGKIGSLATLPVGERYLYVDADCCLFPGLAKWCNTKLTDVVYFSDDLSQYCCGVMLWTQTEQTQRLFQLVAELTLIVEYHDQNIMNWLYNNAAANKFPVRVAKIARAVVANYATILGEQQAWGGQDFEVPRSVKIFHANYCVGVENKTQLLEKALEAYEGICHRA